MTPIFHITRRADWERARGAGEYDISTLGVSLQQQGFIHCSTAAQVPVVADAFFAGETDLVVLTIDPARVGAEIRHEAAAPDGETFPHIYGPLNVDAVVGVTPLEAGPDGRYRFLSPGGA